MGSFFWIILGFSLEMTNGAYTNVALHKPSIMSEPSDELDRLVDGHIGYLREECMAATATTNNWWAIDLLYPYDILDILISNRRADNHRLKNFVVYVSVDNPLLVPGDNQTFQGHLCFNSTVILAKGPHYFQCDQSIRGRFVYLWKPADEELSFCEFQVLIPTENNEPTWQWQYRYMVLTAGRKSEMIPVYKQRVSHPSYVKCFDVCLTHSEQTPTHVQIDTKTDECQCIQYSPLLTELPHSIIVDVDFELYELSTYPF